MYAERTGFKSLPVNPAEVATFYKLPRTTHKDPFDRLIIWQAIQNNKKLISRDKQLRMYDHLGLQIEW